MDRPDDAASQGGAARLPAAAVRAARAAFRAAGVEAGERAVPEETAVSLTYNGGSHAVMMATPQDLEDFAIGFSLHEGVVGDLAEIERLEIIPESLGVEVRMWLNDARAARLSERRRHIAGPTGCGLCGIDSLDEAMRAPAAVSAPDLRLGAGDVMAALAAIGPHQHLGRETRAVHAAGFWSPVAGLVALREDVGRHNALDKLGGALARGGVDVRSEAGAGIVVLTSRVSVEMVQKTAAIGAPVIVAVSAPTALAIRTAEAAGITLIGIARDDGFEVFTHAQRIEKGCISDVA
ncbi:MAG TPA: formate dehydrogenase accessory sulfurtransferase FdhD [Xanthobacteraceae bacterium]|nr:formate dehydrogenase accessory sulfurtransferase FdhD [Xanthobacteraceae bacterium]